MFSGIWRKFWVSAFILVSGCSGLSQGSKPHETSRSLQKKGYSLKEQTQYVRLLRLQKRGLPKSIVATSIEILRQNDVPLTDSSIAVLNAVLVRIGSFSRSNQALILPAYNRVLLSKSAKELSAAAAALYAAVFESESSAVSLSQILSSGLQKLESQKSAIVVGYSTAFLATTKINELNEALSSAVEYAVGSSLPTVAQSDAIAFLEEVNAISKADVVTILGNMASGRLTSIGVGALGDEYAYGSDSILSKAEASAGAYLHWSASAEVSRFALSISDVSSGAIVCEKSLTSPQLLLGISECGDSFADGHAFRATISAYDARGFRMVRFDQGEFSFSVDLTPPTVLLGSASPASLSMGGSASIPITVTDAVDSAVSASMLLTSGTNCSPSILSDGGGNYAVSLTCPSQGTYTVQIKNGVFTDAGGNSNELSNTVSVTTNANGNEAPTISDVINQSTNEDSALSNIAVAIGDVDSTLTCANLIATSSNQTLLPDNRITIGGSGTACTVNLNPAVNQNGIATVTLTVTDGSLTATDTFTLTVNAVNDAPTISDVTSKSTSFNTALNNVAFTIGDVDSTVTCSNVTKGSSNQTVLPNANITIGGSGTSCTVSMNPATDQSGSATLTLTVSDGAGGSASDTFTLTVSSPQAPPVLSYSGASGTSALNGSAMTINPTGLTDNGAAISACVVTVGSLPSGLTVNPNTCVISGTAGQIGTFPVTIVATNSGGNSSGATVTLTVANFWTVTYNGNGSDSGTVPSDSTQYLHNQSVTVLSNSGSLTKSSMRFIGWTTATDGSGRAYISGESFSIVSNVTLYASWGPSAANVYYINDGSTTGDRYTTAVGDDNNSGTTPSAPWRTYGKANSVARDGSIIYIDAGSYNGPWPISYSYTIVGPNYDVSPVRGIRRTEAVINPMGNYPNPAQYTDHISLTSGGVGVTIQGFELTMPGFESAIAAGLIMGGGFSAHYGGANTTIARNYFHDFVGSAIAIPSGDIPNIVISDNKIRDVAKSSASMWGSYYGYGIVVTPSNSTSTGLVISDNDIAYVGMTGISVGPGPGVVVSGNRVSNTGESGIAISGGWNATTHAYGPSGTVTNNTIISANTGNGATEGGIKFYMQPYWNSYTFSGNVVSSSSPGFLVTTSTDSFDGKTFSFSNNRFSSYGASAVVHGAAGTLNMPSNWFDTGCASSSIFSATGTGTIVYAPCLSQ